MAELLFTAKGITATLFIYQDRILIKRGGFINAMSGLNAEKTIQLSQISSVQFKPAGFTNGYIQFSFLGGLEQKGNAFNAAADENSVAFNTWQKDAFIEAREIVKKLILENQRKGNFIQSDDIPTQIKKLAELKEAGILTETEFENKKTELLARI